MALNLGILAGLGEASEAHRKSILAQDMDRRKSLESFWAGQLKDPNLRPEAREVAFNKYISLLQAPYGQKIPKEATQIEDFATVQPKQGSESWLQGRTERNVTAQPMPIPDTLQSGQEGAVSVPEIQNGAVPQLGQPINSPRIPPSETYTAPLPAPPPQYRVPAQYTFEEQLGQQKRVKQAESEATRAGRAIPIPPPLQAKLGVGATEQPEVLSAASSIYRDEQDAAARSEDRLAARTAQSENQRMLEEGRNERAAEAEEGRNQRAADANALRAQLAAQSHEIRTMLAQLSVGAKELPTDIRKGIAEDTDIVKTMNALEGLLEDPASAAEIAGVVGPVDSKLKKWAMEKLDMLSPNQQAYLSGMGLINTFFSHPLFGSALTPSEMQRLRTFLPDQTHHPTQALQRFRIANGFVMNRIYNRMQSMTSPINRQKMEQEIQQLGLDPAKLAEFGRNPLYAALPSESQIQKFPVVPLPAPPAPGPLPTVPIPRNPNGAIAAPDIPEAFQLPDGTVVRKQPDGTYR